MPEFKGFDPSRRTENGHKPDTAPDNTSTNPGQTYSFAAIATELGIDESTVRRRWWAEKLEPALRYCPEELRVSVRTTKSGSPVYELTEFARRIIKDYAATMPGQNKAVADKFLSALKANYPEPETVEAELVDDTAPDSYRTNVGQNDEPGGALALPSPQQTSALAVDQSAIELIVEDLEADRETGSQLLANFGNLLLTNPQALEAAAEQVGRQAGRRVVNAYTRGMNQEIQQGFQQQVDVTQGKSESA